MPPEHVKIQDRLLALVKLGRVDELDDLLRENFGLDVNGRGSGPDRDTALHLAVSDKRLSLVLLLFHQGGRAV